MKNIVVAKTVIVNDDGKLLALKRSETDDRRPLQWDLPGGWVEPGEDIKAGAVREALEEAGITIDPKTLELVYTAHAIKKPKNEELNVLWLFFVGKTSETEVTVSYEHVESAWMSLAEALQEFEYPLHKELFAHLQKIHAL